MTSPAYVYDTRSTSQFSEPVSVQAARDLMTLQSPVNTPQDHDNFTTVSDPLIPDRNVIDRMGHFDPDIYDLRDTSHLMKLMRTLLGGAGAGGLRKQIAIARMQNSFNTTHFLDLDRFYGALFGIVRTRSEIMPDFGTISSGIYSPRDPNKAAPSRYTLHADDDVRTATAVTAGLGYNLGEEFLVTSDVSVQGLRYWHPTDAVVASQGALFDMANNVEVDGTRLQFTGPPAAGNWHSSYYGAPVTLRPGRYKVVMSFASQFCFLNGYFSTGPAQNDIVNGPVTLLSYGRATGKVNGTFSNQGESFGNPLKSDTNYASWGLDVIVTEDQGASTNLGAKFDPFTDAAGSDIWDDLHSRDASYRSRLLKFARALPQGGTYPGLVAACEALLNVDVELYEAWSWIDEIGGASTQINKYLYVQLDQGIKDWSTLATNRVWSDLTGEVLTIGRLNQPNRGEVVVKPKRALREDERYQTLRVLQRIAPAGVQFTVDANGIAIHYPQAIRTVAASSEYWEVVGATTPNPTLPVETKECYQSDGKAQVQPRPAFSQYAGECWSYNNDIASVSSYEMADSTGLTATDFQTVTYSDGTSHQYIPSDAMIPGKQAAAARICADGVMTSFPYQRPSIEFNTTIQIGNKLSYTSRVNFSPNGLYVSRRLSV